MSENRPFLDFRAIRERSGFADVLARYQVNLKRVNPNTLRGDCPLPAHTSKSKGTFYVNEDKKVWYCHSDSCKKNGQRAGGNIIDFVAAMEGVEPYTAAAKLNAWSDGANRNQDLAKPSPSPRREVQADFDKTRLDTRKNEECPALAGAGSCNKPLGFALQNVNSEHPIIQARGITTETAREFGVGFYCSKQKTASMDNRIVFPLHENGVLVGYAGRATLENQEPKWLLGKGLVKSFLYGLERCDPAKPLVIVESPWGVLWLYQNGCQAAALLGSEMTDAQEKCLEPFGMITVALDDDAVGNGKAAPILERLRRNHKVRKARIVE